MLISTKSDAFTVVTAHLLDASFCDPLTYCSDCYRVVKMAAVVVALPKVLGSWNAPASVTLRSCTNRKDKMQQ